MAFILAVNVGHAMGISTPLLSTPLAAMNESVTVATNITLNNFTMNPSQSFSLAGGPSTGPLGMARFGTDFYICDNDKDYLFKFNATFANVSGGFSIAPNVTTCTGVYTNGTHYWFTDGADDQVEIWDSSKSVWVTGWSLSGYGAINPTGICGNLTHLWITMGSTNTQAHFTIAGVNDRNLTAATGGSFSGCIYVNATDEYLLSGDNTKLYWYNTTSLIRTQWFNFLTFGLSSLEDIVGNATHMWVVSDSGNNVTAFFPEVVDKAYVTASYNGVTVNSSAMSNSTELTNKVIEYALAVTNMGVCNVNYSVRVRVNDTFGGATTSTERNITIYPYLNASSGLGSILNLSTVTCTQANKTLATFSNNGWANLTWIMPTVTINATTGCFYNVTNSLRSEITNGSTCLVVARNFNRTGSQTLFIEASVQVGPAPAGNLPVAIAILGITGIICVYVSRRRVKT